MYYMAILSITATLALSTTTAEEEKVSGRRRIRLTLFFQQLFSGPGETAAGIAGIPGSLWGADQFGTFYAGTSKITTGPSPNSTQLGDALGSILVPTRDGNSFYITGSFVFRYGAYNGSTIQLQGTRSHSQEVVGQTSVVSGTGKFEGATGYARNEWYDSRTRNPPFSLPLVDTPTTRLSHMFTEIDLMPLLYPL